MGLVSCKSTAIAVSFGGALGGDAIHGGLFGDDPGFDENRVFETDGVGGW